MHEQVLERLERAERAVRRWRLLSFALGVLLLCSLATGGTLVAMLMMQLPERDEMDHLMMRELEARNQADVARQEAEVARQEAEAARQRLEAARRNGEMP
jgi:hypothetical protein